MDLLIHVLCRVIGTSVWLRLGIRFSIEEHMKNICPENEVLVWKGTERIYHSFPFGKMRKIWVRIQSGTLGIYYLSIKSYLRTLQHWEHLIWAVQKTSKTLIIYHCIMQVQQGFNREADVYSLFFPFHCFHQVHIKWRPQEKNNSIFVAKCHNKPWRCSNIQDNSVARKD